MVIKLTKKGGGAPAREPVVDAETQKAMIVSTLAACDLLLFASAVQPLCSPLVHTPDSRALPIPCGSLQAFYHKKQEEMKALEVGLFRCSFGFVQGLLSFPLLTGFTHSLPFLCCRAEQ